ncbi:hypothetical protein DFH28DRAFT_866306, partial [Melampsora americana]
PIFDLDQENTMPSATVQEIHNLQYPPSLEYLSSKVMKDDIQAFAKAHGYAIVTLRTKGGKKFHYQCDRSGYSRSNANTTARASAKPPKKIGCPFRAVGMFRADTRDFLFQVTHPFHNHPASLSP